MLPTVLLKACAIPHKTASMQVRPQKKIKRSDSQLYRYCPRQPAVLVLSTFTCMQGGPDRVSCLPRFKVAHRTVICLIVLTVSLHCIIYLCLALCRIDHYRSSHTACLTHCFKTTGQQLHAHSPPAPDNPWHSSRFPSNVFLRLPPQSSICACRCSQHTLTN